MAGLIEEALDQLAPKQLARPSASIRLHKPDLEGMIDPFGGPAYLEGEWSVLLLEESRTQVAPLGQLARLAEIEVCLLYTSPSPRDS